MRVYFYKISATTVLKKDLSEALEQLPSSKNLSEAQRVFYKL
jgi:hypothetical protein